jgi:hypothetical protein
VTSEPTNQPEPQPEGSVGTDSAEADQPETLRITDPTVMRALAHPVRMSLLELFAVHDTLTATQASEALGESPANCAFHLRTLAKYGFVEEAGGGRGRERPWRAARRARHMRISSADLESEQAHVAAGALEQIMHERWFARAREAFAARGWSAEWEEASGSQETLTFMTADELKAVREETAAILMRHIDLRRINPSERPPGALPVTIVGFAYPRLDLAAQLAAEAEAEAGSGAREGGPGEDFDEDGEFDDGDAE